MLIPSTVKIHLYCGITDMRKSINTLSVMVQDTLQMDPMSGHLFLFRNRQANKLKALYYEDECYSLWYRRLEKGKFIFPRNAQGHIELSEEHFKWLLASNKYTHINDEKSAVYRDFF